ncbi:uncharacterized protein B0I36DRAFT_358036 [Microdochium trichocladiopsis]|uniref:DUF1168 domain protein n=1 Tax=Microdochium trichocladiopsis TaxID=1682393 RepID=A0A9P8YIR9_9PEZI|nr:uncharacterized protein B0I36DRAFT_358036 [Microdochium trichocladiopsis]KAH7040778.1 hypothetical protein B0I36DRAFT_358036 [Microdochium trichocladiopsis]
MSGEGPESIPTSADPRSKRPTKKRALTPVSAQSATIEALFAKPDQHIPTEPRGGGPRRTNNAGIPEIVANVQGSSAGAGSGEFHVYKAARRREYERLRVMDEELAREQADEEFAAKKEEMEKKDDDKTRRNREKREKMKARKAKAKSGGGGGGQQKNGGGSSTTAGGGGGGGGYSKAPRADALRRLGTENGNSQTRQDTSTNGTDENVSTSVEEPKGIVIEDD